MAVGLDSGDQEDEHSCFSDTTKQDYVYDFAGVKQVWTGDDGITKRLGLRSVFIGDYAALGAKLSQARETTAANTVAAVPNVNLLHAGVQRYLREAGLLR